MILRAVLICSSILASTTCRAESLSWCGPDVVSLMFEGRKDRHQTPVEIELHSLSRPCGVNPEKNGVPHSIERSMRIRHADRWVAVPDSCFSGIVFGVDGLAISADADGVAISVSGKSTNGDADRQLYIYEIRHEVWCAVVEPDPDAKDEGSTRLRWRVGGH